MHSNQWNDLFTIEKSTDYETHLHDTIMLVRKEADRLNIAEKSTLSFAGLVMKQLRFFAWKIWLFQGMVLALLCSLFFSVYTFDLRRWHSGTLPKFLCLCSAAIVISSIPILKRTSRYQMFELEQSTHFAIGGSLLSQLLFIGIGDLFMLAVLILIVANYGLTISVTAISLMIPFMTAATACLMLWSRVTPACFQTIGVVCCILGSGLGYIIVDGISVLQPPAQFCLWTAYLLVCTGILYREYRRLSLFGPAEKMLS
ncbi:MAG: hypothetical protein K2L82_01470 [Lachnospiraceae bacterium]|nr:hypothetical protein [Lachnospiraceae bacterium]